jgi:hypothetical protein
MRQENKIVISGEGVSSSEEGSPSHTSLMGKKSKSQKNKKSPSPTLKAVESSVTPETVVEETVNAPTVVAAENVGLEDEFYDADSIAPSSLNESAEQPSEPAASPLLQSSLSRTLENEEIIQDGFPEVKKNANDTSLLANDLPEETNNDNEVIESADNELGENEAEAIDVDDDKIINTDAVAEDFQSMTLESNEAEPEQHEDGVDEIVQERQKIIEEDGFDDDFDDFVEADQSAPIPDASSFEPMDTDLILQPISFDEIRDQASKIYAECVGERRVPMIRFEFAKSEFRKRLLAARAMEVPSL